MHFEKNNDSSQTITASALGPNTILRSEASEATLSVRADHDAAPKSALRSEASEATLSVRADLDAADNKSVDTDPEQAQPLAPVVVEEPPDGGYGWVCVLSVFLINAHTWGINGVGSCVIQAMLSPLTCAYK